MGTINFIELGGLMARWWDNIDFGDKKYYQFTEEVAETCIERIRQNGSLSSVEAIIRSAYSNISSGIIDSDLFQEFRKDVIWAHAGRTLMDPEIDSKTTITLLGNIRTNLGSAHGLADLGKSIGQYYDPSIYERSHPVLKLAKRAYDQVWRDMRDASLEERVRFFTEDYVRVAVLQEEAHDREGQEISANDLTEPGIALFKEAQQTGDEDSIEYLNETLLTVARYLEGGIKNPLAQEIHRLTEPQHSIDFTVNSEISELGNALLKSGKIDEAFAVFELGRFHDEDSFREALQKRGMGILEVNERIRIEFSSFPGLTPWRTIRGLADDEETRNLAIEIVDRIKTDYPETYNDISGVDVMDGFSVFYTLIELDRVDELIEIVKANFTESEQDPSYMISRLASILLVEEREDLYDTILEATRDLPGVVQVFSEGRKNGLQALYASKSSEFTSYKGKGFTYIRISPEFDLNTALDAIVDGPTFIDLSSVVSISTDEEVVKALNKLPADQAVIIAKSGFASRLTTNGAQVPIVSRHPNDLAKLPHDLNLELSQALNSFLNDDKVPASYPISNKEDLILESDEFVSTHFSLAGLLSVLHSDAYNLNERIRLLEYMGGDPENTNSLSNQECAEAITKIYPQLASVAVPDFGELVSDEGDLIQVASDWLEEQAQKFGDTFKVSTLKQSKKSDGVKALENTSLLAQEIMNGVLHSNGRNPVAR